AMADIASRTRCTGLAASPMWRRPGCADNPQPMETTMKIASAVLLALPLVLLARTDAAHAQNYPWCAQYAIMGSINCGFISLEQCNAALSGNGGYCAPN